MAHAEWRGSRVTVALVLINTILAVKLWYVATRTIETGPEMVAAEPAVRKHPSQESAITLRAPLEVTTLQATLERPLFRPERRPAPAAPAAASPPATPATDAPQPAPAGPLAATAAPVPSPAEMRLVGIVAVPGQRWRAMLRLGDPRSSATYEVGARIGNWSITAIKADSVELEAGRQRHVLHLYAPRSASTPGGAQR